MLLAWGESWPTYWAITAQQSFPNDIKTIYTVGDNRYTSYNKTDYSLDSYDSEGIKGDGCERAIMRFLYKLYSTDTDDIDKFALGDTTIWHIIVSSQPYYFYEFIDALYYYGYSKNDVGLLLEAYGMSATELTISNISSSSEMPTFTWTAKGGSKYFPNDTFSLVFYNQSKSKIIEISDLTSSQYTLTQNEWYTILHSFGTTYYVMIESTSKAYFESGPYFSSLYVFTKPTNSEEMTSNKTIPFNSRYYETIYDILPDSIATLNLNFSTSGYKMIQTFGKTDVYMYLYSSDGTTLIASDDDSGYGTNALIYKYLNSSTKYILKIKCYNKNNSGKTKLSIIRTHNFKNSDISSLFTYEDIWNVNNTTNYSLLAYGERYYFEAITFSPPQSGNYTISLESEFDNFLYVIDPRSTDEIIEDSDYNDDCNDTNAQLTKTLTAGIRYLIVFSQYNPVIEMKNFDEYDNCYIRISLN